MEDIEVIVEGNITEIIVQVVSDSSGDTGLRTELGDFTADLALNYNIAKL